MKKYNIKGFTIVELVIVIAVIAILAGVLIPTFTSIVDKANESSALQEAKNTYTLYLQNVNRAAGETVRLDAYIQLDPNKYGSRKFVRVVNGSVQSGIIDYDSNPSVFMGEFRIYINQENVAVCEQITDELNAPSEPD